MGLIAREATAGVLGHACDPRHYYIQVYGISLVLLSKTGNQLYYKLSRGGRLCGVRTVAIRIGRLMPVSTLGTCKHPYC